MTFFDDFPELPCRFVAHESSYLGVRHLSFESLVKDLDGLIVAMLLVSGEDDQSHRMDEFVGWRVDV